MIQVYWFSQILNRLVRELVCHVFCLKLDIIFFQKKITNHDRDVLLKVQRRDKHDWGIIFPGIVAICHNGNDFMCSCTLSLSFSLTEESSTSVRLAR